MPRFAGWKPAFAFLVLLALCTRAIVGSWNDSARMATIESVAQRGTFTIDDSSFFRTGDKLFIRGHFYSNKPPVLDVAGAGVLAALHALLGIELHGGPTIAYFLLTLILIGGTSALSVALLDRWFRHRDFPTIDRLVAVGGFAVGTLIWPYSTVFNNHTIGGAFLLLGVVLLAPRPGASARQAAWAGLAFGVSLTIDMPPAGIFLVAFFLYLLSARGLGTAAAFAAGTVPALAAQVGLQLLISGDWLPTNLHREYWNYPGSIWAGVPISGEFHLRSLREGTAYAFHSLIGARGFLSFSPFLLWGLAGLVREAARAELDERRFARVVLAALAATSAYLVLFATEYGGASYGNRYFVTLTGILVLFTPSGLWSRATTAWRAVLALALAVSITIAALGVLANPWKAKTPSGAVAWVTRVSFRSFVRHFGPFDLWGPYRWTAPPDVGSER